MTSFQMVRCDKIVESSHPGTPQELGGRGEQVATDQNSDENSQ